MTPTLFGRWQTRLVLFIFLGLPITFFFAWYQAAWRWPIPYSESIFYYPFLFISLILILGLILDILYIQIQRFHWDQDWPFSHQFFFSIVEFYIVFYLMDYGLLDWPIQLFPDGTIPFSTAVCHFTLVFIPSFLMLLGGMQIFMVRWRFKGGEFGRHPIR